MIKSFYFLLLLSFSLTGPVYAKELSNLFEVKIPADQYTNTNDGLNKAFNRLIKKLSGSRAQKYLWMIGDAKLIKIDFGVQLDGIIIDNALSYSRNPDYINLINASKHMVSVIIENIKKGDRIWDIQKLAEEALDKFNEIKGTNFVAISNLAGHQIDKYRIHADSSQLIYPNCIVNTDRVTEIKGDSFYAIEFFVSNGDDKFPGMEHDQTKNTHFMVNQAKLLKLKKMKIHNLDFDKVRHIIVDNFGSLAFCQRFIANKSDLSDLSDKYLIINEALEWFFGLGILAKYPPVLDLNPKVVVSQHEETIYIPNTRTRNAFVLS